MIKQERTWRMTNLETGEKAESNSLGTVMRFMTIDIETNDQFMIINHISNPNKTFDARNFINDYNNLISQIKDASKRAMLAPKNSKARKRIIDYIKAIASLYKRTYS